MKYFRVKIASNIIESLYDVPDIGSIPVDAGYEIVSASDSQAATFLSMNGLIQDAYWSDNDIVVADKVIPFSQVLSQAKKTLLANMDTFSSTEPDGSVRYDANFRELAILYAMQHGLTTPPVPALFSWRSALYAEYATLKAQIDAIADGEGTDAEKVAAIQAIDISVATFEAKFGRDGSVLPDPGILTEQLMG